MVVLRHPGPLGGHRHLGGGARGGVGHRHHPGAVSDLGRLDRRRPFRHRRLPAWRGRPPSFDVTNIPGAYGTPSVSLQTEKSGTVRIALLRVRSTSGEHRGAPTRPMCTRWTANQRNQTAFSLSPQVYVQPLASPARSRERRHFDFAFGPGRLIMLPLSGAVAGGRATFRSRPETLNVHLRGKSMNTRPLSSSALLTVAFGCLLLASSCATPQHHRRPPAARRARRTAAASARPSRRDNQNCGACGKACGTGRSARTGRAVRHRPDQLQRRVRRLNDAHPLRQLHHGVPGRTGRAATAPARRCARRDRTMCTDGACVPGERRRHDRPLRRLQRLPGRRQRLQQRRLRLLGRGPDGVQQRLRRHEHQQHPLRRLQHGLRRRHELRQPAPAWRRPAPAERPAQAERRRHRGHGRRQRHDRHAGRGGTTGAGGVSGTTGAGGRGGTTGSGGTGGATRRQPARLVDRRARWHGCPWTGIDTRSRAPRRLQHAAAGLHDQDRLVRTPYCVSGHGPPATTNRSRCSASTSNAAPPARADQCVYKPANGTAIGPPAIAVPSGATGIAINFSKSVGSQSAHPDPGAEWAA